MVERFVSNWFTYVDLVRNIRKNARASLACCETMMSVIYFSTFTIICAVCITQEDKGVNRYNCGAIH